MSEPKVTLFAADFPVKYLGAGEFITLDAGEPFLKEGDKVKLLDKSTRREYESLYVVSTDTFQGDDLPEGFLETLDIANVVDFFAILRSSLKTYLPDDVQLTVYRLSDMIEELPEVLTEALTDVKPHLDLVGSKRVKKSDT
jgi:hypothetical protein